MKRINLNFGKFSEPALYTLGGAIKKQLTDNPNFPGPIPELEAMNTVNDAYNAALTVAKNGGRTEIAIKNQKKAELKYSLIVLANCLTAKANGDETMLSSTGFPLSKDKQPSGPLPKPTIYYVKEGLNSGDIALKVGRVIGARMYSYQCAPDPLTEESQWTGYSSTLTSFTITGLVSSKRYWFRVAAMGVNGQVTYSDVVSRMVQ